MTHILKHNSGIRSTKGVGVLRHIKGVERYPLGRNHYDLQKFSGPLDPGYLVVKDIIVRLANGARKYLRECSMSKRSWF